MERKEQKYGYDFTAKLQNNGGTLEANGLTWEYDGAGYMGYADGGCQIGSKNNPAKNWTLHTDFGEEVHIQSVGFVLRTASSGKATYSVDSSSSDAFFSGSFGEDKVYCQISDLDIATEDFTLTLNAESKAMYLHGIFLTVETTFDSKLDLKDTGKSNVGVGEGGGESGDIGGGEDEKPVDPPIQEGGVVPGENGVPETYFSPITVEAYYSGIDMDNTDGEQLKEDLSQRLNDGTKHFAYSNTSKMLIYTDESVEQPGKVYGTYDGSLMEAVWEPNTNWNKEHTWPKSRLEGSQQYSTANSDIHNLRPANHSINSSRGNKYFDEKGTSGYYPNEGEDDFRGDVARICFYMATRYTDLVLSDTPNSNLDVSMGILTTLLRWNEEDPVSDFEKQRNDRIYCYQGNRNPFIDFPSIAETIFG